MASEKQIAANQSNAQHSTGPRDTSQTSGNATKHGLLAAGVTDRDSPGHAKLAQLLAEHFRPAGPIEGWLVDRIGLFMVRIERAAAIEKAYLAQQIQQNTVLCDPVLDFLEMESPAGEGQSEGPTQCTITDQDIRRLNDSVGRYETALENKLYRALHELERWQLRRQGENVPAPAAGDLCIHADSAAATAAGVAMGGKGMLLDEL